MLQFGAPDRAGAAGVKARAAPTGGGADVGDVTALLRACLVALRLPDQGESWHPRPLRLWRVSDAIVREQRLPAGLPQGRALRLVPPDTHGREPVVQAASR